MHIWFFIVYFLWHGRVSHMEHRGAFPNRDECVRIEQAVLEQTTTEAESELDPTSAVVYGACREVLTGGIGKTTIQREGQ